MTKVGRVLNRFNALVRKCDHCCVTPRSCEYVDIKRKKDRNVFVSSIDGKITYFPFSTIQQGAITSLRLKTWEKPEYQILCRWRFKIEEKPSYVR